MGPETNSLRGRFAAEVMAYRPAPGNLSNAMATRPGSGDPDGQVVSLGGLGGSITLRLADPIKNRPGPDFVVWGNALYRGEDVRNAGPNRLSSKSVTMDTTGSSSQGHSLPTAFRSRTLSTSDIPKQTMRFGLGAFRE